MPRPPIPAERREQIRAWLLEGRTSPWIRREALQLWHWQPGAQTIQDQRVALGLVGSSRQLVRDRVALAMAEGQGTPQSAPCSLPATPPQAQAEPRPGTPFDLVAVLTANLDAAQRVASDPDLSTRDRGAALKTVAELAKQLRDAQKDASALANQTRVVIYFPERQELLRLEAE